MAIADALPTNTLSYGDDLRILLDGIPLVSV